MKSILSLFKPTQTEVAIQEDISRGREKPKPSTVLPGRQSITPSTLGGSELDQLRASLADMDARLQSAIGERDQLKAEFNDYRQATKQISATWSIPTETCDHSSEKPVSNYLFTSQHKHSLDPCQISTKTPLPQDKTERHYMRLARQLKGDTTGANPQRIERP
jgi:hypothetical protein